MTKRDLVVKIARETGFIQNDVAEVVQKTLDYIAEDLIAGNTIELRNFGVFEIKGPQEPQGPQPEPAEERSCDPGTRRGQVPRRQGAQGSGRKTRSETVQISRLPVMNRMHA